MKSKILLTSTSFQDTPGSHQELLNEQGFEIVKLRGPLKEAVLLDIIDQFDGIICGDDEITRRVIEKGISGKLKIISKYGIGLDKIDLLAAREFNIPVTNCPGVNQVTVAEHVFALLLSFSKNIVQENEFVQKSQWVRLIGFELCNKVIGIIGTGSVGKEVVKRSIAFGMKVIAFDKFPDHEFASKQGFNYCNKIEDLLTQSDVISLNLSLTEETANLISLNEINLLKNDIVIVNTARAGLVDQNAIIQGLDSGKIKGYLTDVLEEEPIIKNHPLLKYKNVLITPHIGSRTYENVVNQGLMAVENLLNNINNR